MRSPGIIFKKSDSDFLKMHLFYIYLHLIYKNLCEQKKKGKSHRKTHIQRARRGRMLHKHEDIIISTRQRQIRS